MSIRIPQRSSWQQLAARSVPSLRPGRLLRRLRVRRRVLVALGIAAVAVAASLVILSSRSGKEKSPAATSTAAYTIVRRDLEATETVAGTLGFASSQTTVSNGLQGPVTRLPDAGAVVQIGAALYEVSGEPVVLLRGSVASYRDLEEGMSDGADVRQLESNLRALGFDPYHQLHVDNHFDFATRAIVERWQRAVGIDVTGKVEASRVIFAAGAVRVGSVTATIGSRGGPVMTISDPRPTVTVKLDTGLQTLVAAGDRVDVDLPDGRTVGGRITKVGRVATADENASSGAVIDVTVALDQAEGTESLDQAPVSVHIVKDERKNVLAVPVTALLARTDGGYAVEVVGRNGIHRQVSVEVGLFTSGYVEITGRGIRPGRTVVVPAL
jgi:peptidoglycan hydrolase-like protein with peptidoglycan-binding domain